MFSDINEFFVVLLLLLIVFQLLFGSVMLSSRIPFMVSRKVMSVKKPLLYHWVSEERQLHCQNCFIVGLLLSRAMTT